jgi:cytochrome d ubiquinol oxidase subunit I
MFNPAAIPEALHMVIAAFAAVGFAVAGIHAALLLRERTPMHRDALVMALMVGGLAAFVQPLSGDYAARTVAATQPVKLAAMEAQWQTERGAPLRIGGIPDPATETTRDALELPKLLSLLAYGDSNAEVRGLQSFARDRRPPVWPVHFGFQIMVGAGTLMPLIALWGAWLLWKKRALADEKKFLRALVLASPLGFIAIEAGWVVTEVGRQPWIVQGVLRTADALTPVPHLAVPFVTFSLLYLLLAASVFVLLRKIIWMGK